MSQHLVMYLIDDEGNDFKDSAALDEFAREVQGGFHENAARATHFRIDVLDRKYLSKVVRDSIGQMLENG